MSIKTVTKMTVASVLLTAGMSAMASDHGYYRSGDDNHYQRGEYSERGDYGYRYRSDDDYGYGKSHDRDDRYGDEGRDSDDRRYGNGYRDRDDNYGRSYDDRDQRPVTYRISQERFDDVSGDNDRGSVESNDDRRTY